MSLMHDVFLRLEYMYQ